MRPQTLWVLAGGSVLAGLAVELYMVKRFEETHDGVKREFNAANVVVVSLLAFGVGFAVVSFAEGDERRALGHIKVGEPPF